MDKNSTLETPQINPYSVMCIIKHKGTEVGRIAAAAHNAPDYIDGLASRYGEISVSYEQNELEAMVSQAVFNHNR